MKATAYKLLTVLLFIASCDCPDPVQKRPLQTGEYAPGVWNGNCTDGDSPLEAPTTDVELHHLSVSADKKTVTHTFIRGGKPYEVKYTVTSVEQFTVLSSDSRPMP